MAPLIELLPPWRNTVTKTTTIYRELPTADNSKMNVKEVTVAKGLSSTFSNWFGAHLTKIGQSYCRRMTASTSSTPLPVWAWVALL